MRQALTTVLLLILGISPSGAADAVPGGMKLIEGYRAQRGRAVDAALWTIDKPNGCRIQFESGPNEGSWAKPTAIKSYSWYRERIVKGYTVRFALTKPDVSTEWDEEGEVHPGSVLLVTFLLGSPDLPDNSANFKAKITNPL